MLQWVLCGQSCSFFSWCISILVLLYSCTGFCNLVSAQALAHLIGWMLFSHSYFWGHGVSVMHLTPFPSSNNNRVYFYNIFPSSLGTAEPPRHPSPTVHLLIRSQETSAPHNLTIYGFDGLVMFYKDVSAARILVEVNWQKLKAHNVQNSLYELQIWNRSRNKEY